MLDQKSLSIIKGLAAAPHGYYPDDWQNIFFQITKILPTKKIIKTFLELQKQYDNTIGDYKVRLRKLKKFLSKNKLDGFIIPKSDEHQGEYIAKRSERLLWLTGFSGPAGQAIILKKEAALFVDGRYDLQASMEVDEKFYSIQKLSSTALKNWIEKKMRAGERLGFDPWLHSETDFQSLSQFCNEKKITLVPVKENPIDQIWDNQPPPPISPARALNIGFSGLESIKKRASIAKILKERNCGALIISSPDSIAWLLNVRGNDVPFTPFVLSFAICFADSSIDWFVDERKLCKDFLDTIDLKVKIQKPGSLMKELGNLVQKNIVFHVCQKSLPTHLFQKLRKNNAKINYGVDPCQILKARKNCAEIRGAQNAHFRDGVAVCNFLYWISTAGISGKETELSAVAYLEKERKKLKNFQGPSFPTISGFSSNGAIVHYKPSQKSNKKIRPNSLLLVDSGGQYLDGTTDITRTIAIGTPTLEMKNNFTRVLKGHIALSCIKFPSGTTGTQLDVLARQYLWEIGLDYQHGTGHGVGSFLSVHEGPQQISKGLNATKLEPGMIISNEPGYYKTGAYGIRIENLVCVSEVRSKNNNNTPFFKFETLTLAPIDKKLINKRLMTKNEINWVNNYHKKVQKTLLAAVDKKTQKWLKLVTLPI